MVDRYIADTEQRYRKAHTRLNEIETQTKALTDEAQQITSLLNAYSRILRDALGTDAVRALNEEIDSAVVPKTEGATADFESAQIRLRTEQAKPSITEAILAAIERKGEHGITSGEIISELQRQGVGPEKRDTIYGTLSRLKTMTRINKVGERFFSIRSGT
jgi:hypothetical protein